jgi:L-amino acid N-acyltransferase YncA
MRIREATVADARPIAEVHITSWRVAYAGIVPAAHLASLSVDERESRWAKILTGQDGTFTYIAVDEKGQVIGFASGGPLREGDPTYAGELYAIYLLPDHKGKGYGRHLASTVAQRLARQGMPSMLVWVLADNYARGFYERLGGALVGEQIVNIGGAELREIAYGWPDTTSQAMLAAAE